VSIPVMGNGDIWQPEEAWRMRELTGCDAVMAGRAALGNPWLPGRIRRYLLNQDPGEAPDAKEKVEMALEHCRRMVALKGESKAMPEMRKHLAWYLKGLPGTAATKQKLFYCTTLAGAEELLLRYLIAAQNSNFQGSGRFKNGSEY
ncbi:MAG: tRNA-dihydrouridine synthase, partial [Clostridiales bacterium]|nr:tRNA-dihydrouridine synthase [Clostridiales bacterium]